MHTLDDLLRRLRHAPGATLDAKISAVVDGVAKDPAEAVAYWRMLAPWALRELERRQAKDQPLVPVGNSGLRKALDEWTRADVIEARGFIGAMHSSLGTVLRALNKLERAYKNDRETFKDVRGRLDPGTLRMLMQWRGPKLLGGGKDQTVAA